MAAPIGNEFWKLAENAGRPKAYQPDALWDVACEYFQWCRANPWMKNEAIKGGKDSGKIVSIPTERPFTIHGLCIFAGISVDTFENYSKADEFLGVTTRIREIIYAQKFEGAAVGAFNANIIARDLGLPDLSQQTLRHTGTVNHLHRRIQDIPVQELSAEAQKLLFEITQKQLSDTELDKDSGISEVEEVET